MPKALDPHNFTDSFKQMKGPKILLDVRGLDEIEESGMLSGAIHIPLNILEERHHEIKKNSAVFIYCRSGGRAGKACEVLNSLGYESVYFASSCGFFELSQLFS